MRYLTERQRDVLAFIEKRLTELGIAPTLREIAEEFGFSSTASAQKHIALLEKKGYLRREKHQKRGLTVSGPINLRASQRTDRTLLMLGAVAAGSPIESIADPETVDVPESMVRSGDHYVLRVRGESMIDDGVHDGDLIIVRSTDQAADGDMVVVLVAGEVTLKRLFRSGPSTIRLQPSNPSLPPLLVPSADVRVQGRVVGLLRHY